MRTYSYELRYEIHAYRYKLPWSEQNHSVLVPAEHTVHPQSSFIHNFGATHLLSMIPACNNRQMSNPADDCSTREQSSWAPSSTALARHLVVFIEAAYGVTTNVCGFRLPDLAL